jgi:hypothetical protein
LIILEKAQRTAIDMIKGLGKLLYEDLDRVRECALTTLEKKKMQRTFDTDIQLES